MLDGKELLYGEVSREQLFFDYPHWQYIYDEYEAVEKIIDSLAISKMEIDVEIFFGTWCGDSRRDVPRFYKVLDESDFTSENKVKLYAVNRKKKLKNELAEKRKIQRVATFIFYKKQKEIGRIVEYPHISLENDILDIINKN